MRNKKMNREKWQKLSKSNFKPVSIGISCPKCFKGYVEQGNTDLLKRQYIHKEEAIVISFYRCPECGYKRWKAIECTGDRATGIMSKTPE